MVDPFVVEGSYLYMALCGEKYLKNLCWWRRFVLQAILKESAKSIEL